MLFRCNFQEVIFMLPQRENISQNEYSYSEHRVTALFLGIRNSLDICDWGYSTSDSANLIQAFHRGVLQELRSIPSLLNVSVSADGISALFEGPSAEETRTIVNRFPVFFDIVLRLNSTLGGKFGIRLGIGAESGTVLEMHYPEHREPVFIGKPLSHAFRHFAIAHQSYPLPKGGKLIIKEMVLGKAICGSLGLSYKNLPNLLFGNDLTLSDFPLSPHSIRPEKITGSFTK